MVTISDVAKKAGVSIATVSNVINRNGKAKRETTELVEKAIEELGYIPNNAAKSLKTNTSRTIGIICEDVSAFSSGEIIDGISDCCEQSDYSLTLCNLRVNHKMKSTNHFNYEELVSLPLFQRSLKLSLNQMIASRVIGLIYIGVYPRDVSRILPKLNIPVVYTYAYTSSREYCINYDDYQGARLAVDYLIRNQHKKIALISGEINSVPGHKRLLGYQTALMENNLPFIPEYIGHGDWNFQGGYAQCEKLMDLPDPPTAIFAMSDVMAYGAISAAIDRGLTLPGDLSVHGFDDLAFSGFSRPELTTIHLPLREMGLRAAQVLQQLLSGERENEQHSILIPCSHVERASVTLL